MAWITVENLQRAINGIAAKVTELFVKKEEGKGLTSNDFTNELKIKLDKIDNNANNYTHPTSAGNKHIPDGGATGQIIVNNGPGTGKWADPEKIEVPTMEGATESAEGKGGLAPKPPAGSQNKFLTGAGTYVGIEEATDQEIDQIIAGTFE